MDELLVPYLTTTDACQKDGRFIAAESVRVGGHLYDRFFVRTHPARTWMPAALRYAGRLTAHSRGLLDAARPPEST
ncbi:MAG TPA: hypothetical protein VN844_02485 [Pyrinomonadaceae bacterium]|nr:hypothetical protein [Pyrinomonadaceae bacterium]